MAETPRAAPDAQTSPDPSLDPAADVAAGGSGAPEVPESREEYLLRQEAASGDTPLARAVNDGLRALARAARSFLLYDPGNEAIRVFLDAYRHDMLAGVRAVTQAGQHGTGLELIVRPFELVWNGEVVYLERDRERSLAFRMFRDGVRRLIMQADVDWDELLRLLQILSIRFTGVRQQEEDIVTLLWKAGFKNIEIVAVEGFVPEDEDGDDDPVAATGNVAGQGQERPRTRMSARQQASFVDAPPDFDLPIPQMLSPARYLPAPVPEEELLSLQQEATSLTLPEQCVRLTREMLVLVADPTDPTDWPDVIHLIDEVRDFLLAEGQLQPLIELVTAMEDLRASDPKQVDAVLDGFVDGRALRRIVKSVPAAHTRPPDELLWLLDHLPGDHLTHALDVLAAERGTSARRIVRQLVARFIEADPDLVLSRIRDGDPSVAVDLLRSFAEAVPARSLEAVGAAIGREDPELNFEALRVLERHEASSEVLSVLTELLDSEMEEVRLRTLDQIASRRAKALYNTVLDSLVKRSHQRLSPREADVFGTTLIVLDQARAVPTLSEWIRPKSFFKRVFHDPIGHKWLQWAAVTGLAQVPGDEHDKVIRWLADRAGSDLADHCVRTLARRRREMASV